MISLLVLTVLACSAKKQAVKPPVFKIVQTTLSKGIHIRDTESVPFHPTHTFTTLDTEIVSHVKYENLSGKHELRWEWYDPDKNLYFATDNYPIETSSNKYIRAGSSWHKIPVRSAKAENYPGTWTVNIFLDGVLAASDAFKVESAISDFDFGNYYALLIGNNNYRSMTKLKTAKNDIQAVGRILDQDYGFDVEYLFDAGRAHIIMAFDKLRNTLTERDNLLVYYAGHGCLDKAGDEGYWLPVDADNENKVNWLSTSFITTSLKAMRAKHVLVVADSCYSGKLARGTHVRIRDIGYFSNISKKRARSVLSSGGLEPVIDSGGRGDHSVFASAFLSVLKENNGVMDATLLFNKIRRPVVLNSDQTPEYSDIRKAGHDGGDFLFIRID